MIAEERPLAPGEAGCAKRRKTISYIV
jgi:hypothetical protein